MANSRPDSENAYVTVRLPNDPCIIVAATPLHGSERDFAERDVVDFQREFKLDEVGKAVHGVAALVTDALEET